LIINIKLPEENYTRQCDSFACWMLLLRLTACPTIWKYFYSLN